MVDSAQDITAALDRFRSFSHVTEGYVGNMEDATLFLNGAAIAQDATGVLLELDEIEEAKRSVELYAGRDPLQ